MSSPHRAHIELPSLASCVVLVMCGCVLRTEPVVSADAAPSPADGSPPDSAGLADAQVSPDADPCLPYPIVDVTASADDGNVAGNTLDGDLDTRWSAEGIGQWIVFDLGQSVEVGRVAVAWFRGDARSAIFTIESSPDGSAWSEVFSGSSSGTTLDLETYSFAAHGARHVRIVGGGTNINEWNSITEVEISRGCD